MMPDEKQSSLKGQSLNPSLKKPTGTVPGSQSGFRPQFPSSSFNKPSFNKPDFSSKGFNKKGPLFTPADARPKPSWQSPTQPALKPTPPGFKKSFSTSSQQPSSFQGQSTTAFKKGFGSGENLGSSKPFAPSQKAVSPPWQGTVQPKVEKVHFKEESKPLSPPWERAEPLPEKGVPVKEAMAAPLASSSLPVDDSAKQAVMAELTAEQGSKGGLKKVLPFLLVLALLVLGGLAIFKLVLPRFQKPKEVSLTYWGLWEPETVMKGIISEWEKKNPQVKINYLQQSPREYRERLQSALARNEGPDVFRFHITWVPMLKNELSPVPSEVMSAASFENTYFPVVKNNLRSETSFLGLPLGIDTLALFYNEDIFQAGGKTPPTSWDQLRQIAIDLTTYDEGGRIQTAGVALGTTANVEHWPDILGLMMLQNGVNLANPTSQLAADALTYYTIFNKTDNVWNGTLPASTLAFATGKVAMFFGYSWDVFEIKNINPNLKFKVVAVPQLPDTEINWASFWVEGVAKRSQNSKQAWEFLKFLSSKESLQKLYQTQSQVRLFGEPYPRMDMAGLSVSNAMVAPFVNQANKAKTWYLCSRTFDNGLNDRMIKYFEDAVNGVNSGTSATEMLSTTAQGVSQLLSQYGIGSYTVR